MADVVDIVASRRPEAFGFHFKVRASGRTYRFEPARDPRQPRFWCFRIYRCVSADMADISERPWLGAGGMTWQDLPVAARAIRADPNAWLATEPLRQLRRWLLEADAAPAPPLPAPHRGAARVSPLPENAQRGSRG